MLATSHKQPSRMLRTCCESHTFSGSRRRSGTSSGVQTWCGRSYQTLLWTWQKPVHHEAEMTQDWSRQELQQLQQPSAWCPSSVALWGTLRVFSDAAWLCWLNLSLYSRYLTLMGFLWNKTRQVQTSKYNVNTLLSQSWHLADMIQLATNFIFQIKKVWILNFHNKSIVDLNFAV